MLNNVGLPGHQSDMLEIFTSLYLLPHLYSVRKITVIQPTRMTWVDKQLESCMCSSHTLFPVFCLWVWDLAGGSMVRYIMSKLEDHSEIPRNPQRNKLHKQGQGLTDRLCLIEKDGRTMEDNSWHQSLDLTGTCTGIHKCSHTCKHAYIWVCMEMENTELR